MADHKEIAVQFLTSVVSGNIGEAYSQYVRKDMRHYNPYFKGDAASLEQGMLENHEQFPHKSINIKHVFEQGDLVATHSLVKLDPNSPGVAAVHILRFEGGRIAEMWDIAQEIPKNMPNENGMFWRSVVCAETSKRYLTSIRRPPKKRSVQLHCSLFVSFPALRSRPK